MYNNPYPGPRPYEQHHRPLFSGRELEASELRSLICSEREVVFYGKSGAGKTSLLNAMVIPDLENLGFVVLPVTRVGSGLPRGIDPAYVDNIFGLSALLSLAPMVEPRPDPSVLLTHTIRSFLEKWLTAGKPQVLILDHLEEIFTTHLGRWQDVEGFFRQIREALYTLPDLGIVLCIDEAFLGTLEGYAHLFGRRLQARYRMALLGPTAALAAIKEPATHAGYLYGRGAAEWIVHDLQRILPREDHRGMGKVSTLGPFVEPVLLQVVCRQLWDRLPEQADRIIRKEEVERYANVEQALTWFYQRAVARTARPLNILERVSRRLFCSQYSAFEKAPDIRAEPAESDSAARVSVGASLETSTGERARKSAVSDWDLLKWFGERLITPEGTRGLLLRGLHDTAGLHNEAVDELEKQQIIRLEERAGEHWVELVHDRLIKPVLDHNAVRYRARRKCLIRILLFLLVIASLAFLVSSGLSVGMAVGRRNALATASYWATRACACLTRSEAQPQDGITGSLTRAPPSRTGKPTSTRMPSHTPTPGTPTPSTVPPGFPEVSCVPASQSVAEDGGSVALAVSATNLPEDGAMVVYWTRDDSATSGEDYVPVSGILTFAPDATLQTFAVTIRDDAVYEGPETFVVTLSSAKGITFNASEAVVTIRDPEDRPRFAFSPNAYAVLEDSGAAELTIAISGRTEVAVGISYETRDGTASAGEDYAPGSGQLTCMPEMDVLTVAVPITDDALPEDSETFIVDLFEPGQATPGTERAVVTIIDNDPTLPPTLAFSLASQTIAESVGIAVVTLQLSETSSSDVIVDLRVAGTATEGKDYSRESGPTVIRTGELSTSVHFTINDDSECESDESIELFIEKLEGANPGTPSMHTVTIVDDDCPSPPTLAFSLASQSVAESVGPVVITVEMNKTSVLNVTAPFSVSGTATGGSDHTLADGSFSITAGNLSDIVTFDVLDDDQFERAETIVVTLGQPSKATLGSHDEQVITITDNDGPPEVSFSSPTYTVRESGGSATITATLTGNTALTASVNYAASDGTAQAGSDYTAASGTLTFAPGDTAHTFLVPILDDGSPENAETVNLSLSGPVSATIGTGSVLLTILDDDAGQPSLSISDASASEDSGTITFTVSLSAISGQEVAVDYATANGTATAGDDYVTQSDTLTIPAGQISGQIVVTLVDDALDERSETFLVNLSNSGNATIADGQATGTIHDDDPMPKVGFSQADFEVAEAGGTATITVSLTNPTAFTATVNYATSDGTGPAGAEAGSDYVATSATLTFTPGITLRTLAIPILDDGLDEEDETVDLSLSSPSNASLGLHQAILTIVDDEGQPTLSIADASADEGDGTMVFDVALSFASALTVTVDYASSDGPAGPGGAVAGADYTAVSGTLEIPRGATHAPILVPILQDGLFEGDQVFSVELSAPANAGLTDALGQGTIRDDDGVPVVSFSAAEYAADENVPGGTAAITVTLNGATALTATVAYETSDGTAGPADYVAISGTLIFTPGVSSRALNVAITDDLLDELDETVLLSLADPGKAQLGLGSALLTIRDDDLPPTISVGDVSLPEANTTMIFPVSLSAPSGLDIRVEYATYDIGPVGATAGADYVAASDVLTLPAGSTSASIPVTILDDLTYELDEPFGLDISAPGATPGDLAALGTILNNDDPPQIQFETGAYSVSEGAGTVVLTVTLTGPTALTATVDYETRSGTATAGEDYSASSGTLTLSPGGIPPAVTVTMTDDLVYEENETFTVILTNAMNASLGITQALVTVYDDDPMPKIGFSSNVYTVTEHAGSVTITVILTPTSEVTATVNYVTSDGTATAGNDYVATNGTLIVVPGVLSNTFTVSITDDLVYEGPETFKVTLTNAVSASLGITQAVVTVLEHDAVVSFSPTAYSVEEDAGRADLTVTLVPATEVTATVSYETRDGTATAGEDYFASSGTLTLCPGGTPATVKVPMMDDLVYEGPETLTVILTNAVNASLGITEALITIDDDDPMPEIDFSSAAYTITEDRGKAVLTVTLSSPSEVTATVNYETHDGTATAGQDYIASSGTLTFIPGATLQTFTVSIADDGLCEGQESIRLSLTNATDAVLGANKAVLTILDPTTLAVDILGSPYAVLDHNNPESEGPHVLVVQGVVTNTGSCAALAPSIRLDGYEDSDTGWLLLMGELPVRRARTLGPGEAYHAYWFATYPPIIGIGHTYTVTAQAANADPVSTSGNRFAPGDPTVQTVGALEGGTSDEQRPFLETRVGIFMTTTVRWDLGANARAAVFSPVGNVDFDPTSLRLVGARLTFTTGVSSEVVHNRLFATVPDGADEARCELVFLTLRPAVTGICPYAALHYQQNLKYDKDYCQPAIPISSTLGITMTKSANASEVQTGDLLTYTIAYTNTGSDRVRHVWIWDNIDPDIGNITSASGEPAVLSSSQVAWNICDGVAPTGEIGSTGAFTFTIRVTANGATPSGTQQIVNHAFLGIDPAGLPSHPALTSTVTITLASPLSATRLALGRIRTEANSPLASRVWTANSYASSWHTLCVSPGAAAPSPIHPWESSPVDWCSNCTCRFAGAFDPRPRAIVSLSWAEAARHVHPWPE